MKRKEINDVRERAGKVTAGRGEFSYPPFASPPLATAERTQLQSFNSSVQPSASIGCIHMIPIFPVTATTVHQI